MQQQQSGWREPRFTVSSGVLLTIFVGAVVFVAYVALQMKPWASDDAAPPEVATATEVPVAGEVTPAAAETPVP